MALVRGEIEELEIIHLGEELAHAQKGEYLPLVALDQGLVGSLVAIGPAVLHAVLLHEALDLAMADHRRAGHRGEEGADAEILVAVAELRDRRFLVRVAHEIDEALEDLLVEFLGVLDGQAIERVLLVLEHVHEGRVVDAVHSQGPREIAFHHPESLGEEEGVGRGDRAFVDHFPPELVRHGRGEDVLGNGMLGPGGDRAARTGGRIPEPPDVLPCQDHGRVEADDAEVGRHVPDALLDRFPRLGVEEVYLRRVVPGHAGAVVAVVDVADLARPPVLALEHHGGVAAGIVVVFQPDPHVGIFREVGAVEGIRWEGAMVGADEEVGSFPDPCRVNAGMVGHHVGGQADAPPEAAFAQAVQGRPAAKFRGDLVIEKGVRRGRRLRIPAEALDLLACRAPLPDADEPEAVDAPPGDGVQLLVGHLVEARNGLSVGG